MRGEKERCSPKPRQGLAASSLSADRRDSHVLL